MYPFRFTTLLTSNADIDKGALDLLLSHCNSKHFPKGTILLRQGEASASSYFVESGLLRMFGTDQKGKEHILQFAPENWFLSDRESAYFQQPSPYFIQALEDTQVLLINEAFILKLSQEHTNFVEFHNRLLHNHIRHMTKRVYQLLSATAEERYLDFIRVYPDLLLRVPQTMVASYLGITPESLSRVRKELAINSHKSSAVSK